MLKEAQNKVDIHGAADEDLFQWCKNLVKIIPTTVQVNFSIVNL